MRALWLMTAAVFWAGCESDKPVVDEGSVLEDTACEPGNLPPTVEITSHDDATVISAETTETFEAVVGDPDDALSDLSVNWYVDGSLVCADADIDVSGQTTCDIEVNGPYSVIRVEVTDPADAQDEDVVVVLAGPDDELDTPPEVTITAPSDGETFEVGDEIDFSALVSDLEDEEESLSVVWLSEDGEILSTEGPDEDGLVTFSTDGLEPGEQVITIIVTDSVGNVSSDSVTITIEDSADTGEGETDDGETDDGETDDGETTGGETDDGETTGGETTGGETTAGETTGGETTGGETTAGETTGGETTGGETTGGDTDDVPVINNLVLSPDPAYTNNGMLCTPTDATPGASFSYRWEINGETVSGVAGSVLGASFHVKHDVVQCFATPYLGSETGSEADSNIVVISNTPPTAPDIHIEPSAPEAEDDLVCLIDAESTDIDGDVISYTFDWTVDGVPFGGATGTIRTGDTIPYSETVGGQSWICTVTPFDGEDTGPSDSDEVTIEDECPPVGGDGRDGVLNVESSTYTLLTARTTVVGDNPADGTALTVADASAFAAGDELLVQATRGSSDDCMSGGAGDWQLVRVASIDGDTVYARDPLALSVDTSDGGRHQVIRIPQYSVVSVADGGTLTAPAFDGETGGVLIFRAQSLDIGASAQIDMSGRGFRGGSTSDDFAEHHGGRSAMSLGTGGAGGAPLAAAGSGVNGAGGGAGGGVSASATGTHAGGGGGGIGTVGGAGGIGDTRGGSGGTHVSIRSAGGGGGADAAGLFPTCSETWGERFVFGSGGQIGGGGGCAAGGAGGDSLTGGCSTGASGGSGGGIVVLLTDDVQGAVGARISADGEQGGHGGDGESATLGAGEGGGGAGNGGVGAGGGKILLMSSAWGDGVELIDAHANGGSGGLGGAGGAGSCLDVLMVSGGEPGLDASDAPAGCGGGGGGGVQGSDGAGGQVMVFGFGAATPVSFPHIADPVYGIEFDGGIECAVEF